MVRINLLPWRKQKREQRARNFYITMAGASGAALLVGLVVHVLFVNMIGYQQKRNQYLESEIRLLNQKIVEIKKLESARRTLVDRIQVIQELQANRPAVVHLFDELVKTIPDGTYLTSFTQKGQKITVDGRAESNTRVSTYMRMLDASDWLDRSSLHIIQAKDRVTEEGQDALLRVSTFKLSLEQTIPEPGAEEGQDEDVLDEQGSDVEAEDSDEI